MEKKLCFHGFECSVQETEDGYTINVKGDKEKLKTQLELIEAYINYRDKAKAAGVDPHPHGSHKHNFLGHLHSHIKAMHNKKMEKCDQD